MALHLADLGAALGDTAQEMWNRAGNVTPEAWRADMAKRYPTMDTSHVDFSRHDRIPTWAWVLGGVLTVGAALALARG